MDPRTDENSSQAGKIVNPGTEAGPDISVGDEGDYANELRFNEEQRLIQEQSHRAEKD